MHLGTHHYSRSPHQNCKCRLPAPFIIVHVRDLFTVGLFCNWPVQPWPSGIYSAGVRRCCGFFNMWWFLASPSVISCLFVSCVTKKPYHHSVLDKICDVKMYYTVCNKYNPVCNRHNPGFTLIDLTQSVIDITQSVIDITQDVILNRQSVAVFRGIKFGDL